MNVGGLFTPENENFGISWSVGATQGKNNTMVETDDSKRVEYAAGWRPEPYKPRDDVWQKMLWNGHAKISDYHVCRNDKNGYSWSIQLNVTGSDYKSLWKAEPNEVTAKIMEGCLVLTKTVDGAEEELGAYLKLPKSCDPKGTIHIDTPPKGGFFVTVSKIGATEQPAPIDGKILGTEPPWPNQLGPDGTMQPVPAAGA